MFDDAEIASWLEQFRYPPEVTAIEVVAAAPGLALEAWAGQGSQGRPEAARRDRLDGPGSDGGPTLRNEPLQGLMGSTRPSVVDGL